MEKIKKREWSYVIMLGISILLFIIGWKLEIIHPDPADQIPIAEQDFTGQDTGTEKLLENHPEAFGQENENIASVSENMTSVSGNMASISENEMAVSEEENTEEERVTGASEPFQADLSYFDDALFIGDSRTVGLMEYGNLGQAEVLADSGMSVYKIRENSFPLRSGAKMNLEELLTSRQFGKVYIMLGINELGYDFDQNVRRYWEMVELIRQMQPKAIIFLQANLHITREKSEGAPYYNNENISRFNQAISEMADNQSIFYLDVNPLFDDGEGALDPGVTTDHAHILGKYYSTWVDWILTQAR
ncbi:MAG: lipase [Lachnospiraceae bacterium]|nr:lipase [Lachnospiraceae bacterium]